MCDPLSDILVDNVRIVGLELNVREVAALSTLSFNKNRQTLLRTAQVKCCDTSALHCMQHLGALLHAMRSALHCVESAI